MNHGLLDQKAPAPGQSLPRAGASLTYEEAQALADQQVSGFAAPVARHGVVLVRVWPAK